MTTPPPGSREAAQALADRLEAHTEQMANTSWGLTMQEWNVISNDILLAARTLRAALAPQADGAGEVEAEDFLDYVRDTLDDVPAPGGCAFCGHDPYHRTEFGEPVGIVCCEPRSWLSQDNEENEEIKEAVSKLIGSRNQQHTALGTALKRYETLLRLLSEERARRVEVEAEVADLKQTVIAFAGPAAARYALDAGFAKGELHPTHYDVLARCGARMVDFKRGEVSRATNKDTQDE